MGSAGATGAQRVRRRRQRARWHRALALSHDADFETFWRRTVHDGVMANTALPTRAIAPAGPIAAFSAAPAQPASGIEIAFRTDPTILDGRFNNNGWLQELPKPLTHLTWDNAVLVSPATMARLGGTATPGLHRRRARTDSRLGRRDPLSRPHRCAARCSRSPAIQTTSRRCISATAARAPDTSERDRGFNAGALRTSDALAFGTGAQIALTGDTFPLACVQYHHLMEGRDIIRAVPRAELAVAEEGRARAAVDVAGAHRRAGEGRRLQVGHVDRSQRLQRLQRVRRRRARPRTTFPSSARTR